jgi:hypothetical protein
MMVVAVFFATGWLAVAFCLSFRSEAEESASVLAVALSFAVDHALFVIALLSSLLCLSFRSEA